ncbi:hypothetical protein OOU_Y34scaffold00474g5 [Pyricularia oryzae Y34]|uniref:Uncharacterized protein n=2 Tax=Pyricularia oryzae TaxID=318829 RepID=A0AA97P0W2_PYRO3|nr:hypothetical protein OOU_Y34scaffold00474g5 [Pyricularia oryzae Y34]
MHQARGYAKLKKKQGREAWCHEPSMVSVKVPNEYAYVGLCKKPICQPESLVGGSAKASSVKKGATG